ncbi:MAG: V-type ATP synthase subunit E [Oscillospiraceae bacterium]|nr:V-type ATP synthase subunit E [Oscillospiraceae bacterium]
MSGLEKMTQKIEADAEAQASEITANAKVDAARILADAEAAGHASAAELAEKSTREVASYRERVASSLEQQRRTALLAARQELIASVLSKAHTALQQKPAEEYFSFLRRALEAFVRPYAGQICFSKTDLARMPTGFLADLQAIAAKKGGSLTLAAEPRETHGGFILIYGGIEENCTFKALFDARKDTLQDRVHRLLFA